MEKNKFIETLRAETQKLSIYSADIVGPKAERVSELQKQLLTIANELETLLLPESLFDLNFTITKEHSI